MSNKNRFVDPHPLYPMAGKELFKPEDEGAGTFIHSNYEAQCPGTPPQIKKYLKSYK